jgi:hypothetical protein
VVPFVEEASISSEKVAFTLAIALIPSAPAAGTVLATRGYFASTAMPNRPWRDGPRRREVPGSQQGQPRTTQPISIEPCSCGV